MGWNWVAKAFKWLVKHPQIAEVIVSVVKESVSKETKQKKEGEKDAK